MEPIEALKNLYSLLSERWQLMLSFKGEYNAGYHDGVDFAMSAIKDMIRELDPPKDINHYDKYHKGYEKE